METSFYCPLHLGVPFIMEIIMKDFFIRNSNERPKVTSANACIVMI